MQLTDKIQPLRILVDISKNRLHLQHLVADALILSSRSA